MLKRPCAVTLTVLACAALTACGTSDTVAPREAPPPVGSASQQGPTNPPGLKGAPQIIETRGGMKGCQPRDAQYGTATIGPSGGELDAGPHRLIIPPGALNVTVVMSATVPEGGAPTIIFEPHGLQFKKPAGLILDASNCFDVPNVVYINEIGVVSDPIAATYSTWWHTIAAPIDHFSGYAVAF